MVAVAVGALMTFPAQLSLLSINSQKDHGVLHMEILPHFFAHFFYTLPDFHRPSPGSDHIEC